MLRSLKELEHYAVSATDGDIGHVADFLLDDERWIVRYLVVETGGFFSGRRVLISPISFRQVDWSLRGFHLALTRDRVKNSPSVDVDKPVSRQHELDYFGYYGYPRYWGYSGLWARVPTRGCSRLAVRMERLLRSRGIRRCPFAQRRGGSWIPHPGN